MDGTVLSAEQNSPLAAPIDVGGFVVGNRWCVHPMEGWDGTTTGEPSEHTIRRWDHFGRSGCKLIWGGEAFAVQGDGRANPNQIGIINSDIPRARRSREYFTRLHGCPSRSLQKNRRSSPRPATHPFWPILPALRQEKTRRKIAYHHPILDPKFGIDPKDDSVLLSDDDLARIIDNYISAAKLAQRVGFQFVDVKACHGYLGHEMLAPSPAPASSAEAWKIARDLHAR